jgi:hypothetical protein
MGQQEASTRALPDETQNPRSEHAEDQAPKALSPFRPASAGKPPPKATSTPILPIRTSASPPDSPTSPIFQSLQSPRIVKAHGDGFTVVEPYPEAQALSPRRRAPRSPPPRYATINVPVPPEKELDTAPRKESKGEYHQVVREGQERRVEESTDPALSSAIPKVAVDTTRDTRGTDRAKKDRVDKDGEDKESRPAQAPPAAQEGHEETVALRKQLDMLRRHREKIKTKAANGQINKEEAKAAFERAEASIQALKRQIAGQADLPRKTPGQPASEFKEAARESLATGTPGGQSGIGQEAQPPSPAKSEKGKARANPPTEAPPRSAPDPRSREGLLARLEDLKSRKDEIKAKVSKGSIDKDEGKAELMKLSMKQHETEKRLESLIKESDGSQPGPSSRPATSPVIASESAGDSPTKKGDRLTSQEAELLKAKIKKRVAEGKMTPEEGKKELKRLLGSPSSSDGVPAPKTDKQEKEERQEGKPSASSPPTLDMVQKQIDKLKQKLAEKSLDPEKGQKELAKLRKLREELSAKESSSGRAEGIPQGSSRAPTEGSPSAQKDEEARRAELRKQMERIKRKVAEGTMEKEEGRKEMARMMKALEGVSKEGKSDTTRDAPRERPKESGRDLPQDRDKSERRPEAMTGEESGKADGESGAKKRAHNDPEREAQAKLAELTKQMDRVKRQVAEGAMEKEVAKKQLEEMARAREGVKLKLQSLASKATSEQGGSSGRATNGQVEESRDELVRQMDRIKRKVKDGSMDKEDGAKAMAKLQKAFAELEEKAKPDGDKSKNKDSAEPLISQEVPEVSKRDRLEGELEENKHEMHSVQKKMSGADEAQKARYEEMLRRLQEERKMLKTSLAKLDQVTERESGSDKSRAARVEDEVDEEEVLDPEILAQVLAEEKGQGKRGGATTPEKPAADMRAGDRVERAGQVPVREPRDLDPKLQEADDHLKGLSLPPESPFVPDSAGSAALATDIPPAGPMGVPVILGSETHAQRDQSAAAPEVRPQSSSNVNPDPTTTSASLQQDLSSTAEPAMPDHSATQQAETPAPRRVPQVVRVKPRPNSETPQNWSEAIVSLAKCIGEL